MLAALVAIACLEPALAIRVAQGDITPPEPLPLGGYTDRNSALFQPGGTQLFCRSLVLNDKSTEIAIVSVEMLTVPESLYREVKRRISSRVHLFLAATHTHCAPDSQMLNERMTLSVPGIANYKRKWLAWYADRIADVVKTAQRSEPILTKTLTLTTAVASLNRNRRNGLDPDRRFRKLVVGKKPIMSIYSAHATILGSEHRMLSGDWPGALAARIGGLVLLGPIGDVSPSSHPTQTRGPVDAFVDGLCNAEAKDSKIDPYPFSWKEQRISLIPVPHPTFAATNKIPEPLAETLVRRFAPDSAGVTAIRLGDAVIIGIPGEPTAALGKRIEEIARTAGFRYVWVVSHVNGWVGYILEAEDYRSGGYEATLSFHGPGLADRILEATRNVLSGKSQ